MPVKSSEQQGIHKMFLSTNESPGFPLGPSQWLHCSVQKALPTEGEETGQNIHVGLSPAHTCVNENSSFEYITI